MDELICSMCEEPIEEGEELEYKGEFYCPNCVEDHFFECCMCGEMIYEDDANPWGDAWICEDCLEDECPSFDKKENEEETTEAYEEFKERFIGRHMSEDKGKVDIDWDVESRTYRLTITTDDEGYITDISRLTCEMLLAEGVTSSEWRSYPIEYEDYEDMAAEELENWLD